MNDQPRTPNNGQVPDGTDPEDIEQLHLEALRGYNPSQEERWRTTTQIATFILRMLPGTRVITGHPRSSANRTDYITVTPNPPLSIFGPDGRFLVSFLKDGTWIDGTGRVSSAANFLEGGPLSIAQLILRESGFPPPIRGWRPSRSIHPPFSDGLRRLLRPVPTNTWRDQVQLPLGQTWDQRTPASICRESAASRLILATYDPNSCTFARATNPRWGVESLRIPALKNDPTRSRDLFSFEQVRSGDCLVTVGPKFASHDQPDYDDDQELDDLEGTLVWHPQRVIRVEEEGEDHLRVWVARDNDVMNDNAEPDELRILGLPGDPATKVLVGSEEHEILVHFQLDVFCRECGNRGKPIVYGMPTSSDPSYLAIGGCVIEPNQPRYTCACGNAWTDIDEEWE